MAISQIFPVTFKPTKLRSLQSPNLSKVINQIDTVGEISTSNKTDRRSFIAIVISIFLVGLLSLLAINTLLTEDAFVLQRLKHQTNLVTDQRDAIIQKVAEKSSPVNLAKAATLLGMIPAVNPEFIDISKNILIGQER